MRRLAVGRPVPSVEDVGVDHLGAQVGVTKQFLDVADVGASPRRWVAEGVAVAGLPISACGSGGWLGSSCRFQTTWYRNSAAGA